ncbi:MAG: carbohydrate kinase family protein, partial [Candidatus Pacebacteria bacterium]|nr:carbohydrate kinase family protein [Candidatus Paceibacterota bacterium]
AREGTAVGDGVAEMRHRVWALMARLGGDRAGEIYTCKVPQSMIDTTHLRRVEGESSGLADIRIQQKLSDGVQKGDRAIYFRAGASGKTQPTPEDLLAIATRRPTNFNISYPGLFPDGMDRDHGHSLSEFVRRVQDVCPMVSMDIHGFTQMDHIRPALSHVDLFNANLVEAARVFLGEKVNAARDLSDADRGALQEKILSAIRPFLDQPTGRTRMFTITDARGCFVILQSSQGGIQADDVPSPCAAIPAKDKTGAGDVRFGLQRLRIARERANQWKEGRFDFRSATLAAQIGQIATTLHVQGRRENALEGVTLTRLTRVAGGGEQFKTLRRLRTALLSA